MEKELTLITIWKDRLVDAERLVECYSPTKWEHHESLGRCRELRQCITELKHWEEVIYEESLNPSTRQT